MTDTNRPSPFRQLSALRDGRPVLIRAARADDRERLVTAFTGLDRQTIYTRYFSYRKSLSETELSRLDEADSSRYILLVATLGSGNEETIIAGASCVVTEATGPVPTAELAFMVEEDYQRQGLAGQMLAAICGLARQRGIARLEADVLAENPAMLAVFRRSGLPMTTSRNAGVVHLVMELDAQAPATSAGIEP
jgi:RimJ/RimL family protein N-acetyltransferase